MKHRATDGVDGREEFVTETCWMQLLPLTTTAQYVLFWYVAETVPSDVEKSYHDVATALVTSDNSGGGTQQQVYRPPAPYPKDLAIKARIAQDAISHGEGTPAIYEPFHHENTAQDEEEMCYRSHLLSIADARRVLKGSVMEDVVRRGWEGIQLRMKMEEEAGEGVKVDEAWAEEEEMALQESAPLSS